LEWFIEKATEIGVDEITPIICHYSERKVIKPERLDRVMISAAKQSKKSFFPQINPICSYDVFLKKYHENEQFIAHCYDDSFFSADNLKNVNCKKQLFQKVFHKANNGLIMIGPEGDFSIDEVEQAFHTGFIPVSLGESRLRTETAGVVACCTAAYINA
jgi:16S rRNA (uracil1498-N3)-methyltransferase